MSGLTQLGSQILDCHDSGMPVGQVAEVLRVPLAEVRALVRAYAGTGDRPDALDELLPDGGFGLAPARLDETGDGW